MGPIDTHWHTFGYDVGMMNELYELKPGETLKNVLMYNSETVILTDLAKKANFKCGDVLSFGVYTSYYGKEELTDATLEIRLSIDGKVVERRKETVSGVKPGTVSKIYDFSAKLPTLDVAKEMKLYITLDDKELFAENEWELYLFPDAKVNVSDNLIVADKMSEDELLKSLEGGKDVLILGSEPFVSLPTTFRIALAGRASGNLATVVADHPVTNTIPNDGFCGWQFANLLEGGNAISFECENVPFNPIVEVVSTHKFAIKQSAMFEFRVMNGRLLVCSLNFDKQDPAANWLRAQLISYAQSDLFNPQDELTKEQLKNLINAQILKAKGNVNFAFNPNDKAAQRKNKTN